MKKNSECMEYLGDAISLEAVFLKFYLPLANKIVEMR
jgi:hypothetical protein